MTLAARDEKLRKMLQAPPAEIEASEQYGHNRDLWLAKVAPLPWRLSWEHESQADILAADGQFVASIHTKIFTYGYAGDIAELLLLALGDAYRAAHPG